MKQILLLAFVLILSACSTQQPQVIATHTAEVTVSLPPTATIIPTPTFSPAFLAIQEQVAGDTQNYTIMGNGNIEGKLPDGTIGVINGIHLNPDGTSYTITVNGEEITIGVDKVMISDEKGVQIEGYENIDGDDDYDKIVKSEAEKWAEANNAGFDKENGVAWDKNTGLVIWAQDAKGEWINYPDGNVPIPPGPGYESLPPLEVPYYASFTEAMTAIFKKLPWGYPANIYRASQEAAWNKLTDEYWRPMADNGTWHMDFYGHVNIHRTSNPKETASVWFSPMLLPNGNIEMWLVYDSLTENFSRKPILIHGDAKQIKSEIQRIDQCVKDNPGSDNLADLCASDMIKVASSNK